MFVGTERLLVVAATKIRFFTVRDPSWSGSKSFEIADILIGKELVVESRDCWSLIAQLLELIYSRDRVCLLSKQTNQR